MRKLPVYLLIDTSGSMQGEPIESVKVGLEAMLSSLRSDPYALETVNISIITFDRDVKQLLPLTPLDNLQMPDITTPESGPTHTGRALQMLCENVDREVNRGSAEVKGDWMPLLFLMTDGKPSDIKLYREMVPEVKQFRSHNRLRGRHEGRHGASASAHRPRLFARHDRQHGLQVVLQVGLRLDRRRQPQHGRH